MGAISIDVSAGEFRDSSNSLVSDSSIWAIIYDDNDDGILPGGLTLNSSLAFADQTEVFTDFSGQQILTNNIIGLDRILWAGEVDSAGLSGQAGVGFHSFDNIEFSDLGVSADRDWAIYWFPQLTTASNTLGLSAVDVGGLQRTVPDPNSGSDLGMVFPPSDETGTIFTASFFDSSLLGSGDIAPSDLTAINAIPEPGTALLSFLGLAGLLRRKR